MLTVTVAVTLLHHFSSLFFDNIPLELLLQCDDQWSDGYGLGLKQIPICEVSVYNLRNRLISNRLSVIQNQHRRLIVGHSVLCYCAMFASCRSILFQLFFV